MNQQGHKTGIIHYLSWNFLAYYSVFIGIIIIVKWIFILISDEIKEGRYEITLHVFSEFLMAIISILSGFMIFNKKIKGYIINLVAQSMIIYSVINAIGYYLELRETGIMPLLISCLFFSFYYMILILNFLKKWMINVTPE